MVDDSSIGSLIIVRPRIERGKSLLLPVGRVAAFLHNLVTVQHVFMTLVIMVHRKKAVANSPASVSASLSNNLVWSSMGDRKDNHRHA